MIQTNNLTKYFDQFLAVDRVNLQVRPGEVLALLGPNGAGKTTTVRMLTTVLKPSRGTARVGGYDIREEQQAVRSTVGVLTEDHGLYERMYVEEYLDFFGQLYAMSSGVREQRIEELTTSFGLDSDLDHRIGEFSKGMRQKLSLARTLLHSPSVLLLDEPTSAMDPESARLVHNAIKQLRSNDRAIIICTHNLAEAELLADKIAIIRQGRIIAQGTPADLKEQLLGPDEFMISIRGALDGKPLPLPDDVQVTATGKNWFRYLVHDPEHFNPLILRELLEAGFQVVRVEEIERRLESVYLRAVNPDRESL